MTPAPEEGAFTRIIAAEEICPAGAAYAPPILEGLALFLTRQGRAQLQVGAKAVSHQPGTFVLVASGCVIQEQVALEQPWHVCYLLLSGPWADGMDRWLRRLETDVQVWRDPAPRRRLIVTEMVEGALTQTEGWPWRFLSQAAELWGSLYHDPAWASAEDALTLRLAHLLDAVPADRLTLAEMAGGLGLTPRQLLYQFGKATGEPLAQWIWKRRISTARRLLSQGHSVTAVAEQLGYANPYHFSRAFKSVTGLAPSVISREALHGRLNVKIGPAE